MRADPAILPLEVADLGFQADGRWLLRQVSFRIEGGRSIVLGHNGAGKSLMLRLCHGLLTPAEGQVRWRGPGGGDSRQKHAMVFQRPVLLRRPARDNLLHALALAGLDRRSRALRADAALERFGLAALAGRAARVLSGGEQQRLAIARAWAVRPQLVFLDEPTAHLDPAATKGVEAALEVFRQEGTAVVMTTHDLGQARRLADQVLFLHQGRLLEQTPAPRFFDTPRTPQAAAFLRGEHLD